MNIIFISTLVVLCCKEGLSKVAPAYIKPCQELTPECLKKTAQEVLPLFTKGIPELGIDSTDPLRKDYVNLDLPGGLKVEIFDGKVTGFRKCVIDSLKLDKDEGELNMHCNITIKGKYKATGRVLIITLNGDGDAKIKATNVILNTKFTLKDITRDGVVYYNLQNFDVNQQFGDKVSFALTNLFQGSPELSQTVLAFLNQNWRQIADEFGKPIIDKLVELVTGVLKKFFASVPKEELFNI